MDNKKRMLLFMAVTGLLNIGANLTHPVTPTIFTNLNLGSYMFGYALAAMLAVNFAVSPFWGKINSYISSRVTLLICCVGYGIGQIMFGLSTLEWQFILVRMFAGAFTGGAFVSVLTYIVNMSDDMTQRSYNLTRNVTIQSVFGAFGYLIGGVIGSYSPYLSVWVQAGVLITCGFLFFAVCKDDATVDKSKLKASVLIKEANPFASFVAGKQFLTISLVSLFVMCSLQNMSFTAFDQSFNYYIRDMFAFPSSYNGALKGVMGIITLIVNSTICIWIIRKTNVLKANIIILLLCSLNMILAIIFTDIIPFIIFNVILFAVNAISVPVMQKILTDNTRKYDSNLVMGFYNAMKSFGGIIGAFASGALYSENAIFPFMLVALGFILSTLLAVFYLKRSNLGKP